MEEGQLRWLKALLKAEFYGACQCASPKHRNLFCTHCMDSSFCDNCRTNSHLHHGHLILQVYKSSCRVGLRISAIDKLFDASDIQPYISNSSKLVYINKKQREDQDENGCRANVNNSAFRKLERCEACGYELQCPRAKFCSIECKVMEGKWRRAKVEACQGIEPCRDATSSSDHSQPSSETNIPILIKKSKRKGIPRRAPFF